MAILSDPRLAPPTPESHTLVRQLRNAQLRLGKLIMASVRPLWPKDMDGQFTVIFRNGNMKVNFGPPPVKDAEYHD